MSGQSGFELSQKTPRISESRNENIFSPRVKVKKTKNLFLDSLFEDVLCVHPSVVFGQFDGKDDAGNQQDAAGS